MRPSDSGLTWTTSAPRSSCACAICPTVGNSYSLMTIRFRSPLRSSAETSALTAWETEVVTATSSGCAPTSLANAARAASFRSTQNSHSAPFSSQPASHSSAAARTRFASAPCEHEFAYVVCSKIGNSARADTPGVRSRDMSLAAEVGLAELLVLDELGRVAVQDDSPRREDIAAVGDRERHVRVLLDHEERDPG